jgi:hypothetical protein
VRSPGFFSHASFPCGLPCSFSWLCSASRWDTVPCIYLVIVLCVYSGVPEDLPDVTNILANSPMPGELRVEEWNCTLPGTRLLILPRATSVAVCILCRTGCRFASRRAGSSTGFLRCLGLRRSLSRLSACGVLHHGPWVLASAGATLCLSPGLWSPSRPHSLAVGLWESCWMSVYVWEGASCRRMENADTQGPRLLGGGAVCR